MTTNHDTTRRLSFDRIRQRVRHKRENYARYNFSRAQNDTLKTFFDLAQEYDSLPDFYRICVAALLEIFGVHSRLYIVNEKKKLQLVCDSEKGLLSPPEDIPDYITFSSEPYETEESFVIPVSYGSERETLVLPHINGNVLGMFEAFPASGLLESDRFFLIKYANRIAYNLYKRMIARQNVRHLKFINNLVMDIEHNVIIPNMHFRFLLNQMRKNINALKGMSGLSGDEQLRRQGVEEQRLALQNLADKLEKNYTDLRKHHANVSLFLESLFRRDHFEKGHLVLRFRSCKIEKEVIIPQLEHYESRLAARGITIVRPHDMREEELPLNVDFGLLSQVYANLFSNAAKYTRDFHDYSGRSIKTMAYGREIIPGFFSGKQDGIKFNVYTTGPHLEPELAARIFDEGVRGDHDAHLPGSGHGLSFVKQVVEIHGGVVGYEPTYGGNNFIFILPLSSPVSQLPVEP